MDLLENIDKLKTTELGKDRIRRNLALDINIDPVVYCKDIILNSNNIEKKGKNWYIEGDDCIITVNSYSFGIITAHPKK